MRLERDPWDVATLAKIVIWGVSEKVVFKENVERKTVMPRVSQREDRVNTKNWRQI